MTNCEHTYTIDCQPWAHRNIHTCSKCQHSVTEILEPIKEALIEEMGEHQNEIETLNNEIKQLKKRLQACHKKPLDENQLD